MRSSVASWVLRLVSAAHPCASQATKTAELPVFRMLGTPRLRESILRMQMQVYSNPCLRAEAPRQPRAGVAISGPHASSSASLNPLPSSSDAMLTASESAPAPIQQLDRLPRHGRVLYRRSGWKAANCVPPSPYQMRTVSCTSMMLCVMCRGAGTMSILVPATKLARATAGVAVTLIAERCNALRARAQARQSSWRHVLSVLTRQMRCPLYNAELAACYQGANAS